MGREAWLEQRPIQRARPRGADPRSRYAFVYMRGQVHEQTWEGIEQEEGSPDGHSYHLRLCAGGDAVHDAHWRHAAVVARLHPRPHVVELRAVDAVQFPVAAYATYYRVDR